jgi:creatinine amidohydrolase/Fe(II)-dependent formamide hydrolase-like protein
MKFQNRRRFFKVMGLTTFTLTVSKQALTRAINSNDTGDHFVKPADEMRPGEFIEAVKRGPYAFIPVSPTFEWHSFHLPMGTDAIIPQELSKIVSGKIGGVWFRPLSLGLDAWRTPDEKEKWGFEPEEDVYGMNFPDLPLKSEYCETGEMIKIVKNRIKSLEGSGIKEVFLINHHGGKGQFDTIEQISKDTSTEEMRVHALKTYQFNDLTKDDGWYGVGGHAGYSETTWLAAFRPDLVDLKEQKSGELSVRNTGILHSNPTIEAKWNPQNISFQVADLLKERVVENLIQHISQLHPVNFG